MASEGKLKVKLVQPAHMIGDWQDVGKTFEVYEKEAAALVGRGVAEYVGKKPESSGAKATEAVAATQTRKRGSRSRSRSAAGSGASDVHPETDGVGGS